jgi:hypothetical protein
MSLLDSVMAPQHPVNPPKVMANSPGFPVTLLHSSNSDSDELMTQNQTKPYLQFEPTSTLGVDQISGFLQHIFQNGDNPEDSEIVNLDLSDLKYDPLRPRQAEEQLAQKLNDCIKRTSPSKCTILLASFLVLHLPC